MLPLLLLGECHGGLNLLDVIGIDDQRQATVEYRQHGFPTQIYRVLVFVSSTSLLVRSSIGKRLSQLVERFVPRFDLFLGGCVGVPIDAGRHAGPDDVHANIWPHGKIFPSPAVKLQDGGLTRDQSPAGS
ncbi:MAG: hypothetical protein HYV60_05075 [Planctomycetia bacterium]|nr:hypothetical protein [Planctomycetia bacterium]